MRAEICSRRSRAAQLHAETEDFGSAIATADGSTPPAPGNGAQIAALPRPAYDAVPVFVGAAPGYQGPVAGPRPANTPIGAIAYAPPEHAAAPSPIKPDPKALLMKREAQAKQKAKPQAKASHKAAPKASAKPAKEHQKAAAPKPAAKHPDKAAAAAGKTGQN
jgi:D-alanyl-D-alanine carboxypeptidase